jgi:hypothetical protein
MNVRNGIKEKVPLRIELRLSESKSDVITITPWNRVKILTNTQQNLVFWFGLIKIHHFLFL